MWPRLTKAVPQGPYEVNYACLERCLKEAKCCVVIGFSFRDDEIRRYFTKGVAENRAIRLAIIDPDAETIMQKKLGIRKSRRFKAFPSFFDEDSVPSLVAALQDFAPR